jgi:hypothetical protein
MRNADGGDPAKSRDAALPAVRMNELDILEFERDREEDLQVSRCRHCWSPVASNRIDGVTVPGWVTAKLDQSMLDQSGSDPFRDQTASSSLPGTLRNVDKRPRPDFVKAYMHNGYLKSLQEVVHFYNTRDTLPRCKTGDPGEKVTCWPAPEHPETMNRRQLGNLGLTRHQERQIVAFLKTLMDDYTPPSK